MATGSKDVRFQGKTGLQPVTCHLPLNFIQWRLGHQRKEMFKLQRAGIPTASAEALLQRMLDKIDALCEERSGLRPICRSQRAGCLEAPSGDIEILCG
jgi:hypothetical protein